MRRPPVTSFKSDQRPYLILDAPGHIEFLKNMITGAARAEAALLVIDAAEGVQENSRRHGYMVSLLGIRQLAVLVNKMDLVNWDQAVYDRLPFLFTDERPRSPNAHPSRDRALSGAARLRARRHRVAVGIGERDLLIGRSQLLVLVGF